MCQGKNVLRKLLKRAILGRIRFQLLTTMRITIAVVAEVVEVRMSRSYRVQANWVLHGGAIYMWSMDLCPYDKPKHTRTL